MENVSQKVAEIIAQVRTGGDKALCRFAKRFDGISMRPQDLVVNQRELDQAKRKVPTEFLKALDVCGKQIRSFAESEKRRFAHSWLERRGSVRRGQLIRAVDSAGLYIPGGRFPYPSTVLMTAIPAHVAGVKRILMASPPKNLTPEVLAAAAWAGVDEVYRVGGAGAIAALALGTQRIRPVHMVVGPGNKFVTEAKRQLFGTIGIDLLAGPSEVVIIADRSASIRSIVEDLQAQAEHDPEARALLLSQNASLIREVSRSLSGSIRSRVQLKKVGSLAQALEEANAIGPEHLELLIRNPERCLPRIRHAGAIFLGPATPAALGDYVAGPSHVLPTQRSAHFSSGLSVMTFLKRSSVIGFAGRSSERTYWKAALTMAETEGMEHHARSLRSRMQS